MKVIASFYWDCGRQGDVDGLFLTDLETLEAAYGKQVYFGEILGKHSCVYGTLDRKDIEIKSQDQDFIAKFIDILGDGTISGYNPLDCLRDNEDEDEDNED